MGGVSARGETSSIAWQRCACGRRPVQRTHRGRGKSPRVFVVAITGAAILGAEPPRATAQHFVLTFTWAARIFAGRLLIIIHLVEIVAPFPNVAGDVVKTPRIRLLLADRARVFAGIFFE